MTAKTAQPVKSCSILLTSATLDPPNVSELKTQLESSHDDMKILAMKKIIMSSMAGENLSSLLMHVIRFALPSDNKVIKKLLLIYWEITPKLGPDGKLLPEMVLVCNYWRNDLNSPNEYVRGATLRFLTHVREMELLEPLMSSIRINLEHKNTYVRRNAVSCVYTIYKHNEALMPDGPEAIHEYLEGETDMNCKRNAFLMLHHCAPERAVAYLSTLLDSLAQQGDLMQLLILELIRRLCRTNPQERSKYLRAIITLLSSQTPSVQYEAAGTIVAMSTAATAVRAAAETYISLLVKVSDNNVKMIVLDRLNELKDTHTKVLQEQLMDIMRALNSPSLDIRQKTLDIALDLIHPRNIDEVISVLKKELTKTQAKEMDKATEYRQMLITAIHGCAVKFPEVAAGVAAMLMEFLGDANTASAADVILFVREVIETYPNFRHDIIEKLLGVIPEIRSPKVLRAALWIVSEYAEDKDSVGSALSTIKGQVGELPIVPAAVAAAAAAAAAAEASGNGEEAPAAAAPAKTSSGPKVLADGTYASQSAASETSGAGSSKLGATAAAATMPAVPHLRSLILGGDFFLASAVATSLTKLVYKAMPFASTPIARNGLCAQIILTLSAIVNFSASQHSPHPMEAASFDRLTTCIRLLAKPSKSAAAVFLKQSRVAFSALLKELQDVKDHAADAVASKIASKTGGPKIATHADDLLDFGLLRTKRDMAVAAGTDEEAALLKATGATETSGDFASRLSRVYQLTGFSDPVYAEVFVVTHQYDIMLEVLVVNQTHDTLQNLTLELACIGDLQLVERPQMYTLAPKGSRTIVVNIKVSSTESGLIFGNIVYDVGGSSANDRACVVLSDIHVDIMDYINPAHCTDATFRHMWSEFEWENKVQVNTPMTDLRAFLNYIAKSTNMQILTPESALGGECGFLAANLYAKSIFGEDALANVSLEGGSGTKVTGYIRIRSKTQGIALSLGDKITVKQKSPPGFTP